MRAMLSVLLCSLILVSLTGSPLAAQRVSSDIPVDELVLVGRIEGQGDCGWLACVISRLPRRTPRCVEHTGSCTRG